MEVVGLLHHELGELQRASADLGGHVHTGLAAVRLERLHEGQRSSLEASSSSLRAFSSRSKAARVALFAASKTGSRSAIFLLTSCSSTLKSSLSIWASVAIARADPTLP